MDTSGKCRAFLSIIRTFAKEHDISRELTSYGWSILGIHVLLRHGFITPIQHNYNGDDSASSAASTTTGQQSVRRVCGDIDVTFDELSALPVECADKLAQTSLFELLYTFFRYMVMEIDVFGKIVTLRGKGEVRKIWGKYAIAFKIRCYQIFH